jgi:hypothetical protein
VRRVTFCLACGAETPSGGACARCGAPLGKAAPPRPPSGLLRRPAFLYYALVALAGLAALAALVLLLKR